MASMGRLVRAARACRKISSSKTLNPMLAQSRDHGLRPCQLLPPSLGSRSFLDHLQADAFKGHWPKLASKSSESFSAILACLFGIGLLDIAYADYQEEPAFPSERRSDYIDLEELAKQERRRLEELLRSQGLKYGSYPKFTLAVKGQKITIKFEIPPTCEVPRMIASLGSHLGLKVAEQGSGSDMMLRAWDSSVAWQLTLSNPEKHEGSGRHEHPEHVNENRGELCILISRAIISSDKAEIEFIKQGSFSDKELDAFVSALQLAAGGTQGNGEVERKSKKSVSSLEELGVRVFGLDGPHVGHSGSEISWENIAGYHQQKREIEDTVLLALKSPEVYDDIAHGTRCKFESNRPRAVLFEGPPGTGKTSCARVIANQAGVPLLYVPLEVVMSKYYGESERLLGKVFSLANELMNGAIVFLDEVDSLAISRDSEMHEATRRILSVLLRQIDGFEQDKKVVVIAATNRKQDLDPALMSRFDSMVTFSLPDQQTREAIAAQYAKHLTKSELAEFARATEEMSGRDIRDVCQQAERHWASKIIRGQIGKEGEPVGLPPLQEYIESTMHRRKAMLCSGDPRFEISSPQRRNSQLDFL